MMKTEFVSASGWEYRDGSIADHLGEDLAKRLPEMPDSGHEETLLAACDDALFPGGDKSNRGAIEYTDDEWRDHILGEQIRQAMDESDLRQSDLAERIGVGQSYISEVLAGKHSPGWRVVMRIAEALEIAITTDEAAVFGDMLKD